MTKRKRKRSKTAPDSIDIDVALHVLSMAENGGMINRDRKVAADNDTVHVLALEIAAKSSVAFGKVCTSRMNGTRDLRHSRRRSRLLQYCHALGLILHSYLEKEARRGLYGLGQCERDRGMWWSRANRRV